MLRSKRIAQIELDDEKRILDRLPRRIRIRIGSTASAMIVRHEARSVIDWLTRWLEDSEKH